MIDTFLLVVIFYSTEVNNIMTIKIHIFGASGSGTSTLGRSLSSHLGIKVIDADDFYWKKTNPPFQEALPLKQRAASLDAELDAYDSWILTGTIISWGGIVKNDFDAAIYLYVPVEERVKRLAEREQLRFGERVLPGGDMYRDHQRFLEWAAQYDIGHMGGRNKMKHQMWISELNIPVKKFDGLYSVEELLKLSKSFLSELGLLCGNI